MVTKKTHNESSLCLLARLAELYGVQTRYRDALGRERESSHESLLKTLLALGAEVNGRSGLASAVRVREAEIWGTMIEPVMVAWQGMLPDLVLRLPASTARSGAASACLTLTLEDGSVAHREVPLGRLRAAGAAKIDGRSFVALSLPRGQVKRALARAGSVPSGYHRLRVEVRGREGEAVVIAAPRRCWEPEVRGDNVRDDRAMEIGAELAVETIDESLRLLGGRNWGLFAPVYALRSRRDWGAGDLADLQALAEWTGERGGSLVATLPLLSASFGEGADPSPYRPLTRLFWNEVFLALEGVGEWASCPPAQRLANAADTETRRDALRESDIVDYQAVMALKRPVIERLAFCFFEQASEARRQDYQSYLRDNPFARDYAAFRAAGENGGPGGDAGREAGRTRRRAEQYHLYCQWQMDRQLAAMFGGERRGLLFDLPLGVHPDGFDAGRWPELFASDVSTGAPPDKFFANGQEWTTPPLRPQGDRRAGYPYFGACLRNLMRHASVLRIDHMMSFHRLFWIPAGMEPKDGAYVNYPAEELYAVLSRESHRHQTAVVGEDLGTVPVGVRASMARHAVARTWIFMGSLLPRSKTIAPEVPEGAVATLETHDMVPLAGFLRGDDIQTRVETGQVDSEGARRELAGRRRQVARLANLFEVSEDDPERATRTILSGCLAYLARSAAQMVLVNLEDLLLERRPQNVPGTHGERPNWRRKIAVPLEELPRALDVHGKEGQPSEQQYYDR